MGSACAPRSCLCRVPWPFLLLNCSRPREAGTISPTASRSVRTGCSRPKSACAEKPSASRPCWPTRNLGAAKEDAVSLPEDDIAFERDQPRLFSSALLRRNRHRRQYASSDLLDQQWLLPVERMIIVAQIRPRADRIRPDLSYRASTTPRRVGQDIKPNGLRCGVPAGFSEFGLPGNLNIVAQLLATGFLTKLADLFG